MSQARKHDFSLAALYAALDARRQVRDLTWLQVTREINAPFAGADARGISAATVRRLRSAAVAEADGVLQILRWLSSSPESFVPDHAARTEPAPLPIAEGRILRFDTRRLHAALDARRAARHLTWSRVAAEIGGTNAATLTRLAKGGRTGFPLVQRIVGWLEQPAAWFVRASPM